MADHGDVVKPKLLSFEIRYLIIPFIYLLIAIPFSYFLNIWIDDVYTLQTTSLDFQYTIKQSLEFESQPPLYFILLYFWRQIDESIFFARLLNIVFVILTLLLIPAISKRFVPKIHPIWFQLIILIHPVTQFITSEIRCYAMVVFLSALLTYLFYEAYISDKSKIKSRIFYIIAGIIGVYTQYYFSFVLLAFGVFLIYYRNWKAFKKYLFDMIFPVVSLAIFVPLLLDQIGIYENLEKEEPFTIFQTLRYLINIFESQILALKSLGFEEIPIIKYIIRLVIIVALIWLYKSSPKEFFRNLNQKHTFFIPFVTIILLFFLLIIVMGQQYVYFKYTLVAFIPVWIFWLNISIREKSRYLFYFNIILFLFSLVMLFNRPFAKINDYKKIADYIESVEEDNQPLLVYRNELVPPFRYYYNGINEITPIPFEIDYNQPYDHSLWAIDSISQVKTFFNHLGIGHTKFWLITDSVPKIYGIPYNYGILEEYIEKHYEITKSNRFYDHVKVRLLELK